MEADQRPLAVDGTRRGAAPRHGHKRFGKRTPTYQSWRAMKLRCLNPRQKSYGNYGGRGVAICDRWLTFDNFLADMGERPDGTTLERKDNALGYEPGNCCWAARRQQTQNRRTTKLEEHEPEQIRWLASRGYSCSSIGRFFGVSKAHVCRIVRGECWR